MQINLIPKTREQEQKRNQINSIIIIVSASLIISVSIIAAIFYGINSTKKSSIKENEKKISDLRAKILDYSDVEKYITTLVTRLSAVKEILDGRRDLTFVYRNLQALLPREAAISEMTLNSQRTSFVVKANSIEKVVEAIKALEDYEVELLKEETSTESESAVDKDILKEENSDEKKSTDSKKVKMFTNIDVAEFTRGSRDGETFYQCSIVGTISEEIWQKI
ncbi:hypothetical protein HGB13_01330 [bacterium]|nr:hypothetical protein [bacterium]